MLDLARHAFSNFLPDTSVTDVLPSGTSGTTDRIAVVGFSGPRLKGALGVSVPPMVLEQTHPSVLAGESVNDDDLEDWLAEMANQLLGRFKAEMIGQGVTIWLATPLVLRGVGVHLSRPPALLRRLEFQGPPGTFWAWFDLVPAPELVLVPVAKPTHAMPGEVLRW